MDIVSSSLPRGKISQVQKEKEKEKTEHFKSYLEYTGVSQSDVQKEKSTMNVLVHKASNTLQDEEPCVDLGGINIEEKVHAIL